MTKSHDLHRLLEDLRRASGPDLDLDSALHRLTGASKKAKTPRYTSSVDDSLALLEQVRPGWHWHVGYGATGVLPYASLAPPPPDPDNGRAEAEAPTVPLALLTAMVMTLVEEYAP